jgi:hypothetical protein
MTELALAIDAAERAVQGRVHEIRPNAAASGNEQHPHIPTEIDTLAARDKKPKRLGVTLHTRWRARP